MGDAGTQSSFIGPVIRWNLPDTGRVRARIAVCESRTLRAQQETDDAFKANVAAGSTLALRLLESAASREAARQARLGFSKGEDVT